MKKYLALAFCAVALSGCGGEASAPVNSIAPAAPAATPQFTPSFSNPCEYAQQAFIRAFAEYEKHQGNAVLHERQVQARLAMESVCKSDDDKDSGVWACAEGHSCR